MVTPYRTISPAIYLRDLRDFIDFIDLVDLDDPQVDDELRVDDNPQLHGVVQPHDVIFIKKIKIF